MLTPVEWIANEPRAPYRPIAIVRVVLLGDDLEPYWRVVTYGAPHERKLIGYWGNLAEAEEGIMAWWEQSAPPAWLAQNGYAFREPRKAPTQKQPPTGK